MRFDRSVAWISRGHAGYPSDRCHDDARDEPADTETGEEEDAEPDERVVAQLFEGALVHQLLEALELGAHGLFLQRDALRGDHRALDDEVLRHRLAVELAGQADVEDRRPASEHSPNSSSE